MPKAPRTWTYRPAKPTPPAVPTRFKQDVETRAQHLIDTVLAPRIPPPPLQPRFNYVVRISTAWWRHYFYFIATYCSPGPHAIAPSFDHKFARLQFVGRDRFDLAFMRHTGQWIEVYQDLTLDECLASLADDHFFML